MMLIRPLVLALALMQASAAAACDAIRFLPGASEATLTGMAPPEDVVCFTLDVGEGQSASMAVTGPNGMAATIPGVIDNAATHRWTTRAGRYEIWVGQTFRAAAAAPFTLTVGVTGGS